MGLSLIHTVNSTDQLLMFNSTATRFVSQFVTALNNSSFNGSTNKDSLAY